MAEIDDKITEVMREMARRRWAKTTPEDRKAYARFLVSTRKVRGVKRIGTPKEQPVVPGISACDEPEYELPELPQGSEGRVFCFRCESGYHDRCLDKGEGFECYCRRKLNHQV